MVRELRGTLVVGISLLLGGCSVATDPSKVQLAGCWAEAIGIPGASLSFQLAESDTTIRGTGTFTIEAGPFGTVALSGHRSGAKFRMTLTYSTGSVRYLDATITSSSHFEAYFLDSAEQRQSGLVDFHRCE